MGRISGCVVSSNCTAADWTTSGRSDGAGFGGRSGILASCTRYATSMHAIGARTTNAVAAKSRRTRRRRRVREGGKGSTLAPQGRRDDRARFFHDAGEVLFAAEALGVDLVHVLGARGAGREPSALGDHLESPDLRAISRRLGEAGADGLAGQRLRRDL